MSNKVDFLPEDYLDKKSQRRTNIVCLFLFLMVVGGVGSGVLMSKQRQKSIRNQAEQINKQMIMAGESLKKLEMLEKKKQQMMTKASISAMLMEPVPRSLLLATITNNLSSGVSLIDYKLTSKTLVDKTKVAKSRNKKARRKKQKSAEEEKKDITPPKMEVKMEFTGLAPTDLEVAQFIANLNKSHLFSQVNLVFSEEHTIKEEMMRRYCLEVVLDSSVRAGTSDVELARQQHIKGM